MTEINVIPWIEVNEMMDDTYRQQVVTDALDHLPKASPELNKFALGILEKAIQIRGFRSFKSIPPQIVKNNVMKEFKSDAELAALVICLWAEKQHEIIETLSKAAREANIPIPEKWDWHKAGAGFFSSDDTPELNQLANTLSDQKTKPESDHYLLAALWLSGSLFELDSNAPASSLAES